MITSGSGHFDIVKFLVNQGANISAVKDYGRTALKIASKKGHLDVVNFLVNHKANINASN